MYFMLPAQQLMLLAQQLVLLDWQLMLLAQQQKIFNGGKTLSLGRCTGLKCSLALQAEL